MASFIGSTTPEQWDEFCEGVGFENALAKFAVSYGPMAYSAWQKGVNQLLRLIVRPGTHPLHGPSSPREVEQQVCTYVLSSHRKAAPQGVRLGPLFTVKGGQRGHGHRPEPWSGRAWQMSRFNSECTPRFLIHDFLTDRRSSILGVCAAPGGRETFQKGGGRSPQLF